MSTDTTPRKPLRLWPGVLAVVLQWLIRFVVPILSPDAVLIGLIGELAGGVATLVWWVFFSRAVWAERIGAVVVIIAAVLLTPRFLHESILTGMMGMMFMIYVIPVMSLSLVAWAVATRSLPDGIRRATMVGAILLACGVFTLLRTGGITGNGGPDLKWRWAQSPEERLLSKTINEPMAHLPASTTAKGPAEWPGFRGADRDGAVYGVRIETDWLRSPPVQMWRRPVGPGWSSCAVLGDLLYTQEQRGEDEVVACYELTTGEPVWRHGDHVRFWESNAGAGPRATPTICNGRIYSFGATGILNALDADSGTVGWSRNVASDSETKVPGWGFTSSPLVIGDVVVVSAYGKLAGYDMATGKPRWSGPPHSGSYSSPHRFTVDGVTQIVLLSDAGATSVGPADGTLLWEYRWPGFVIVQPATSADGDLLISTSSAAGGMGIRRLAVDHAAGGWTVKERWTSSGLKPYFNDLVVHNGHAYGFDGSLLACIDLADGARKWKGGRYGNGQLILLADQDVLLVLSEKGDLALVGASPEEFKELARAHGIEGKTWNHPVLAGGVLVARNSQEMAAFRLSLAGH